MEHTATPWRIKQQPKKSIWITSDDGFHIAEVNKYAETHGDKKDLRNAELIVRAVNSHADLLAACEWMMKELCEAWDETEEKAIPEKYRAALAKAKEGL